LVKKSTRIFYILVTFLQYSQGILKVGTLDTGLFHVSATCGRRPR